MRLLWIIATILGTCARFSAGYLTGTRLAQSPGQDATRQELLKQLVATKAVIETGVALDEFRASDKNVQTALELAANRLNDDQSQAARQALHAISQTVAAWDETFTKCHAGRDGYVWLGDFARNGSENPNCNDKKLEDIYGNMGVLSALKKWSENPVLTLAPKRGTLLQPLFSVSLDRIQFAINSLQ